MTWKAHPKIATDEVQPSVAVPAATEDHARFRNTTALAFLAGKPLAKAALASTKFQIASLCVCSES